jgi:hypothetical protein
MEIIAGPSESFFQYLFPKVFINVFYKTPWGATYPNIGRNHFKSR